MNILLSISKYVLYAGLAIIFFVYGRNVPFSEQRYLYEALRNMSAIIFGIMGIWVAVLYPDILKYSSRSKDIQKGDLPDSRHLISPMIYAAISLTVALIIPILKPIVAQFSFLTDHVRVIRGLSFSIVGTLSLLQIWALVLSFVPYVRIKIIQERQVLRMRKINALAGRKGNSHNQFPEKQTSPSELGGMGQPLTGHCSTPGEHLSG